MNIRTNTEYQEIFRSKLKLEERGFILQEDPTGFYQNRFVRDENFVSCFLNFSIQSKKLYALSAWIDFKEVEDILTRLVLKYELKDYNPLDGVTLSSYPFVSRNSDLQKILNQAQSILLIDSDSIDQCVSLMNRYVDCMFVPFWSTYSNIRSVNELLDSTDQQKLSNYIPGPYMDLKKLILMRLGNNVGYVKYRDWLKDFEEADFHKDPSKYEWRYKMFCELTEILKRR